MNNINSDLKEILQNSKVIKPKNWEDIEKNQCLNFQMLQNLALKDIRTARKLLKKAIEETWVQKNIYLELLKYGNKYLREILTELLPQADKKFPGIVKEHLFPQKKSWVDLVPPDFEFPVPKLIPKLSLYSKNLFPEKEKILAAREDKIYLFFIQDSQCYKTDVITEIRTIEDRKKIEIMNLPKFKPVYMFYACPNNDKETMINELLDILESDDIEKIEDCLGKHLNNETDVEQMYKNILYKLVLLFKQNDRCLKELASIFWNLFNNEERVDTENKAFDARIIDNRGIGFFPNNNFYK